MILEGWFQQISETKQNRKCPKTRGLTRTCKKWLTSLPTKTHKLKEASFLFFTVGWTFKRKLLEGLALPKGRLIRLSNLLDVHFQSGGFNSNISGNLPKYRNYNSLHLNSFGPCFWEFPLIKHPETIGVNLTLPLFGWGLGLSMWRVSSLVVQKFES